MGSDRHKCKQLHLYPSLNDRSIASRRDRDRDSRSSRRSSRRDRSTSSERRRDRKRHKSHRSPHGSPEEHSTFQPLFFKGSAGAKIAPRVATERPKRLTKEDQKPSEYVLTKFQTFRVEETIDTSNKAKSMKEESGVITVKEEGKDYLNFENEYAAYEWEENEKELDRAWYDQDEEAPFIGNFDEPMEREQEESLEAKRKKELQPVSRRTMNLADHEKWEINRMVQSGAMSVSENYKPDLIEEDDDRVVLMTHDIKPPFLDGRISFTTQAEAVQVVRDPNSDFAKLSKKGSSILKHIRERNDKTKMRERFWELAGSKLGDIMKIDKNKVKEEEQKLSGMKEEADEDRTIVKDDGEVDYKESSKYAKALTGNKEKAVSTFAKTKTIQEQREYLPIYEVR